MVVNATPARGQIGGEQVASAVRRARLSLAGTVFDLAIAANVGDHGASDAGKGKDDEGSDSAGRRGERQSRRA